MFVFLMQYSETGKICILLTIVNNYKSPHQHHHPNHPPLFFLQSTQCYVFDRHRYLFLFKIIMLLGAACGRGNLMKWFISVVSAFTFFAGTSCETCYQWSPCHNTPRFRKVGAILMLIQQMPTQNRR